MDASPTVGDTLVLDCYVPAELLPLTTHTFSFSVKRRKTDADAAALVLKTSPVGCIVKDAAAGWVQIRFESAGLPALTPLYWTFRTTTPEGNVHTLAKDTLTLDL